VYLQGFFECMQGPFDLHKALLGASRALECAKMALLGVFRANRKYAGLICVFPELLCVSVGLLSVYRALSICMGLFGEHSRLLCV